jgi:hypothetical protein
MDSPAYDDISLLLLMADSKPEALSRLYLYDYSYSPFVSLNIISLCSYILRNFALAKKIAQEVFLHIGDMPLFIKQIEHNVRVRISSITHSQAFDHCVRVTS